MHAANRVAMEMLIAGVFPLTPTEKQYTYFTIVHTAEKFKSQGRTVNYRARGRHPSFKAPGKSSQTGLSGVCVENHSS
jgi:hypothetical protein